MRIAVAVAVATLVAWAAWAHWQLLAASPFPVGVDGYFYAIQVRSLLEHGVLQYPASPLAFWWMAPFAAATDPIVGAKLGAALGGALIAVPAYGIGARLGRSRGAGLVAAAAAASSAGSAYLTLEFVKQGVGLTVALAAVWLVLRAARRATRGRVIAAAGGLVAALLTHKMAGAFAIVVAGVAAFAEARGRGALRGRRLFYLAGAAVALGVVGVALGIAAPHRFVSLTDLGLVRELFSRHARWDAPALVAPRLTFDHEALIGGVVSIGAAVALRWRDGLSPGERMVAWVFVAFGVVAALPWLAVTDPQGLGFRLRIAGFVPLAVCAAIALPVVVSRLPAVWRERVLVGVAVLLAVRFTSDRTEGRVLAHPALVAATLALEGQVPETMTVIVPERHVAYMVAWYVRVLVSLRPERVPYPERMRLVLPLSPANAGFPLGDVLDAARREPLIVAPLGVHPSHRNGLVLVTEPTWDWVLAHLPPDARRHFAAWPTI